MTERVIDRVMAMAGHLREQAVEAERFGRLTDQTAKAMKAAGNIRLLQPAKYNGYRCILLSSPETVMATASLDPAAGWINGVVGVHPYLHWSALSSLGVDPQGPLRALI
jgi:3-hydroxy-9,10-secoandrosta-1,3,5(10)-triene-9,17-dione monooxygenase